MFRLIIKASAILAIAFAAHIADAADVSFITVNHVDTIEIVKKKHVCHYPVTKEQLAGDVDALVRAALAACK
jgi:hypothetical protein